MAGLSMGGMQTRTITLAHLDKFSHIGVFSGGSIALTNITDMAAFKEKVKLVFVSYGSRELDRQPQRRRTRTLRRRSQGEHRSAQSKPGSTAHFYVSPKPRTNGNPGGAACMSSLRCCSRTNQTNRILNDLRRIS